MPQIIESANVKGKDNLVTIVKLSNREVPVAERLGYRVINGKRHVQREGKNGVENAYFPTTYVEATSLENAQEISKNIEESFTPDD